MESRPYDCGLDLEEEEEEEKTMMSFTSSVSSDNDDGCGKVSSATKECDDVGSAYKNDDLSQLRHVIITFFHLHSFLSPLYDL